MRRKTAIAALLVACVLSLCVRAAEVLIDEDFSSDPSVLAGGNWVMNGSAAWDPDNERVVVTPAENGQLGTIFWNELLDINNFRLEAKVKLCCGSGADGMTITLIQADDLSAASSIGDGGGGMAVTNMTTGPQIVVEFDIWGNSVGCEDCASDGRTGTAGNHVGVEYSPTGFPPGDCLPNDDNFNSGCASDADIGFDLYDTMGNFTIDIVVQVQDAIVTVDIGSEDRSPPVALHRVMTFELQDYTPFEGLVGVTASTGGANAEQSIYSLKLASLPAGVCLAPPGTIERTISGSTTRQLQWEEVEAYEQGVAQEVSLQITSLRQASGNCGVPSELTVEEVLPAGWTVQSGSISDGGTFADGKITWVLTGGSIAQGKTLTYQAVPGGENVPAQFFGTVVESNVAEAVPVPVGGETQIYPAVDRGYDELGFIRTWLLLGPYQQPAGGGDAPGEDAIAQDYLTDGALSELTILPEAGATIDTDFGGASPSPGILATPAHPEVNPGGIPTWLAWSDATDTITFDDGDDTNDMTAPFEIYGTVDNVMAYAAVYVNNTTGQAIHCNIGLASDDSIQVILNGASIWIHNIPRGAGGAGAIQDVVPAVLNPGVNRVLLKIFEGGGGFQFRFRFQNLDGTPITEGIEVSLTPPTEGCAVPPVVVTRGITPTGSVSVEGTPQSVYIEGTGLAVVLSVSDPRQAGAGCAAAGAVTIVEYLPPGWTATDVSNGGEVTENKITWSLPATQLAGISELTYVADGPVTAGTMGIAGSVIEQGNALSFTVGGQGSFVTDFPLTSAGYITTWLMLGPFMQQDGNNPGNDLMRQDHLTDGDTTELDIMPRAGDEIETDFLLAASTGLAVAPPGINPNGIPMWHAWRNANERVNFQHASLYGALDNVMAYAVCYLLVEEPLHVKFGCGSDDSIQILLDDQEVWINSIPRGWGGGAPQDHSPLYDIEVGIHRVMVKVFEGGGDWVFGVRLEDENNNPVRSGFKVLLSPTLCTPPQVIRQLGGLSGTVEIEGVETPVYREGDTLAATLRIFKLRPTAGCPAQGDVTIRETLPAGWSAENISDSGTLEAGVITWTIPAAQVAVGKEVTYEASGPVEVSSVSFSGTVSEQGIQGSSMVEGLSSLPTDSGISSQGVILTWLLLGPLGHTSPAGNHDPVIMARDHLHNGFDINEIDVRPEAGDSVAPDFNGMAASTGLLQAANPEINPNWQFGEAEWYPWRDADGAPVDLTVANLYGANDNAMNYAVCYLDVQEPILVQFAAGSDDAIQVLLDGEEIWLTPASRGWPGFADLFPIEGPVDLDPGVHFLMVKCFNGVGGWNFGVQILDDGGMPLTEGYKVCLIPEGCAPAVGVAVHVGDTNGDGGLNIADAVTVLQYLFAGGDEPACLKAADANDDGGINIADAVSVLSFLFANKPMKDPAGAEIAPGAHPGCTSYNAADVADVGCNTPCAK